MKKDFNKEEIARLLTFIVPVGLILMILIISLIVGAVKNRNSKTDTDALQENIMGYADANLGDIGENDSEELSSSESSSAEATASAVPTASAAAQATASPTITEQEKVDYSKVTFDKDAQLQEMMSYWADNNQKALDDLANLDRFKAMSWKLSGTTDCYYYGDMTDGKANGTGIAVYADNQYYYGEWKNGVRSGDGTWMHYHIHTGTTTKDLYTFHSYTGRWANDLPSGEGSEHYDFVMSNLKPNVGYNRNLIGTYKNGLYHGDFYITNIYSDENVKEWNATAVDGSWQYIDAQKDTAGRRKVQVETIDDENFIWMLPKDNKNLGVLCLIAG